MRIKNKIQKPRRIPGTALGMQTDIRNPFEFFTRTRHKVLEWDQNSSKGSGEKYFNFLESSGHCPLISTPNTFRRSELL